MPHPTPRTSHLFITPAPFLPTNPPQARNNPEISPTLLKYTHMRAALAHARDRPRGTETLPSNGVSPGIHRGVPCGRTGAVKTRLSSPAPFPCPPVLLCHAAPLLCPENSRRHYRFVRDRRHPQLGGAQNVAETNRLPAFAGTTVLGAPSNLKQAPAAEKERCLLLLRLTSGACKNRLVACASGLRRALRRSISEAVSAWKLSRT